MINAIKDAEEVRAVAITAAIQADDEAREMCRTGKKPTAEQATLWGDALAAVRIAERNLCRAREDENKRAVFKRPAMVHAKAKTKAKEKGRGSRR